MIPRQRIVRRGVRSTCSGWVGFAMTGTMPEGTARPALWVGGDVEKIVLLFLALLPIAAGSGVLTFPVSTALLVCGVIAFLLVRTLARRIDAGLAPSAPIVSLGVGALGGLVAVVVYITGGAASPLLLLFGPVAVAAASDRPRRHGIAIIGAAVLLTAVLCALGAGGALPAWPAVAGLGASLRPGHVVYALAVLAVQLAAVLLGTDYMVQRVTRFEREVAAHDERSREALGRFAAILAHEIRNPLAGIKGAAGLIEKQSTGDAVDAATAIRRRVDELDARIGEVLSYVRPGSGHDTSRTADREKP